LSIELLEVDAERAPESENLRADGLPRRVSESNARNTEPILEWRIDQQLAQPVQQPGMQRDRLAVEDFLAPQPRQLDEGFEHAALEGAGILQANHRQGEQVFVIAGGRKGVSGSDLPPVLGHGVRAFRTVDAEACREWLRIGEQVIADPGEGEI